MTMQPAAMASAGGRPNPSGEPKFRKMADSRITAAVCASLNLSMSTTVHPSSAGAAAGCAAVVHLLDVLSQGDKRGSSLLFRFALGILPFGFRPPGIPHG